MAHEEYLVKMKTPEQFLGHVAEETAEVIVELALLQKAIGKTVRFGPNSVNPTLPVAEQEKNIDWVLRQFQAVNRELDDLALAMDRFLNVVDQMEVAEES